MTKSNFLRLDDINCTEFYEIPEVLTVNDLVKIGLLCQGAFPDIYWDLDLTNTELRILKYVWDNIIRVSASYLNGRSLGKEGQAFYACPKEKMAKHVGVSTTQFRNSVRSLHDKGLLTQQDENGENDEKNRISLCMDFFNVNIFLPKSEKILYSHSILRIVKELYYKSYKSIRLNVLDISLNYLRNLNYHDLSQVVLVPAIGLKLESDDRNSSTKVTSATILNHNNFFPQDISEEELSPELRTKIIQHFQETFLDNIKTAETVEKIDCKFKYEQEHVQDAGFRQHNKFQVIENLLEYKKYEKDEIVPPVKSILIPAKTVERIVTHKRLEFTKQEIASNGQEREKIRKAKAREKAKNNKKSKQEKKGEIMSINTKPVEKKQIKRTPIISQPELIQPEQVKHIDKPELQILKPISNGENKQRSREERSMSVIETCKQYQEKYNYVITPEDEKYLNVLRYYEKRAGELLGVPSFRVVPRGTHVKNSKNWIHVIRIYDMCQLNGWDYGVYIDSQFERTKNYKNCNTKRPFLNQMYSENARKCYENYVKKYAKRYSILGDAVPKRVVEVRSKEEDMRAAIEKVCKSIKEYYDLMHNHIRYRDYTKDEIKKLYLGSKIIGLPVEYLATLKNSELFLENLINSSSAYESLRVKLKGIRRLKKSEETIEFLKTTIHECEAKYDLPLLEFKS